MGTTAPEPKTLFLIDGHAQLYRAHHTHLRENRRATDGTPTGALYGFFNHLRAVQTRFHPDLLGCVFDPKGGTFRQKEFAGYKAQRAPMPDDLKQQVPVAFELCQGLGIPAVQVPEFEADDVLGTLARQAVAKGFTVTIITGDKDLLQLVNGTVKVWDPFKSILYDAKRVETERGLRPDQIADLLGLMGDNADNIPGVFGVGETTAQKLLAEHGTLEAVLAHFQEKFKDRAGEIHAFVAAHYAEAQKDKAERQSVKAPKGVKVVEAYIFAQAEQARASRELATIRLDAPETFDAERYHVGRPDYDTLVPLLQRLDFRQFLRFYARPEDDLLTMSEQKAAEDAGDRTYHTVDTPEKLAEFAALLKKQKRFAVDTETTDIVARNARLVGLSFCWKKGEAHYIPVRGPMGAKILDEAAVLAAIRGPLEDPAVEKIGQNIKYDLNVLRRAGVSLKGVAFDTLLAGWLLDPGAMRHDLDSLAYVHLRIRKTATGTLIGRGKASSMDLAPVEDVARYACEDADVTWQLAETLAPKLAEAGLDELLDTVEAPLIEVLAEMEWTGIFLDADMLRQMSDALAVQLQAQEEEIYKQAGARFNIHSPRQLGEILFDKLGLPVIAKTSKGQPSTGEEVLNKLALEHDLPKLIVEYRGFAKLKSTYVDALPEMIHPETQRIHASFHQTGAETGRLSSSDPNLQNIPVRSELGRSIRAAFKPQQPGWKILAADYSQIELRVLAHYSKDASLLEAFARGEDIHTAVAARLFDVPAARVDRDQRARAKTVNFGVLYGQSAFGLANTLSISQKEAKQIIDRFFDSHPGVRGCIEAIVAGAREKGYVTTILGRRRFVPQLKDSSQVRLGERIAVNTVFQGSAADLIKKAMLDIHRALYASKRPWQARMILQIHDELLFECPSQEVPALTELVKDKMEHALALNVPLTVDAAAGDDWLNAKD